MKRKEPDYEPYEDGSFTQKVKGKAPSKLRPEFDETKFDLNGLGKTYPPLDLFFSVLSRPVNSKLFITEREEGRVVRRGTIWSILALEEIYYPKLTEACNSDLDCISNLLKSKQVTKNNFENVYKALNVLMNPTLYSETDAGAEQTRRGTFLDALKAHPWYQPSMRSELLSSKTFLLSDISMTLLKKDREQKKLVRLKQIIKVPDIDLFAIVKILVNETGKSHDEKWLVSAIQLVQASVGSRWIEVTNVSKFSLPEDKYQPDTYIVVRGLAKDKSPPKVVEEKNGDILEEIDNNEEVEFEPSGVVVKPVLWREYGVTPAFIVQLVGDIREYLAKRTGSTITTSKASMKAVRDKFLGKTIDDFDRLWEESGIEFRNKTHTWRKVYGSYSHLLYDRDGNLNIWLMQVLGHSRIETSFSYANVVITQFVKVQDEDLKVEYSRLKTDYQDLVKLVKQQGKMLEKLQTMSYVQPQEEEDEEEIIHLVALPMKEDGSTVNVPKFDRKEQTVRFKKDQTNEKEEHMNRWILRIENVLKQAGVEISEMGDGDWERLGVVRSFGRELSKRARN